MVVMVSKQVEQWWRLWWLFGIVVVVAMNR
jgi:hypothetical protein